MASRRLAIFLFLIWVLTAAAVLIPASGFAHHHHRVYIGVGPVWWGPWWGPWWAPPVYVHPVPVPVPPPCRDIWIEGHWDRRPHVDRHGFTTYYQVWIPGHWERVCP